MYVCICMYVCPGGGGGMNESEARVDLVLIETLLLSYVNFQLISMRAKSLT